MYRNFRKAALIVALLGLMPGFRMVEQAKTVLWHPAAIVAENNVLMAETVTRPEKSAIIGNWVGQIETKNGDLVSVKMRVYPKSEGSLGFEMIYGGKRSCTLDGSYEGELKGEFRFSLNSKGGVYCDNLNQVSLAVISTDQISFKVTNKNGQVVETGILKK
jgi:hypothetical protein